MLRFEQLMTLRELTKLGPDSYLPFSHKRAQDVCYLRKVLGKDIILTANGVGYRLTDHGRKVASETLTFYRAKLEIY